MVNLQAQRQRGMGLLGLLFVAALVAVVALVGIQALPTVMELQAVNKAVNKARDAATPAEARAVFDRAAQVDDIKSISGKDLDVVQAEGRLVVSFAYEREIHLVGPAYLTLKYAGRSR